MSRFGVNAGRPSRRRLGVVSIAVLAMLSPLGVVSSAEAVAPPAAVAMASPPQALSTNPIWVSPTVGKSSTTFTIRGRLPVKSRMVYLQIWSGTRWVVLRGARFRTTVTGAYVFRVTSWGAGVRKVRVRAPQAVIAGRLRAAYVTPYRTYRVR
jgi:hypothetical protein